MSDGGTVWLDPLELAEKVETPDTNDVVVEYGKFAYLEGKQMHSSVKLYFPPFSVLSFCLCDKVDPKQEVCFS